MVNSTLIDRLRGWLPLLPLLLLLLGSYWLSRQVQPLQPSAKELRHDVDFVIDQLSSTALDGRGAPRFVFSAEKMWHFPDDDSTHLQRPQLTRFFGNRPPTEISAARGMLDSRGEDIFMQEAVEVLQPARDGAEARRFRTDYLHVQPDQGRAMTHLPVRVSDRRGSIEATGMELDEQASTIKLLSEVRGVYAPPRH